MVRFISVISFIFFMGMQAFCIKDLFSYHKKNFKVGDIITISVSENAQAQHTATTRAQKQVVSSISQGNVTPNIFSFVPNGQLQTQSQLNGRGSTVRQGSMKATITAQVVQILPNGNLVIVGEKKLKFNYEMQIVRIRGIVRPEDVEVDNTVDSKYIANCEIEFVGRGVLTRLQKGGLLNRLFNWLF